MYQFQKLPDNPIILLTLTEKVEADDIRDLFLESANQLQKINGTAALILDFSGLKELDTPKFTNSLQVFYRIGHTVKPDAPILLAMAGTLPCIEEIGTKLRVGGITIPAFEDVKAAETYLNLKIAGTYARQGIKRGNTDELQSTLHIAKFNAQTGVINLNGRVSNFPNSGVLKVQDTETRKSLLLIPHHTLIIGRRGQGYDKPDLDLTFWGAFHKGVSRLHAKIVREGSALKLVDLNSANGTFINGDQVMPDQPAVICDGDEITFGRLVVRVFFQDTLTITNMATTDGTNGSR